MADMRRRSPEPPPGAPQIQLKPGLAKETLRELAPLLAEEGIDVDNLDIEGDWQAVAVRIANGQTWRGSVDGTVTAAGCLERLEIDLLRGTAASSVASIDVWLDTGHRPGLPCRR